MSDTLKEKLVMKIDQEYDELVEELKKSKPETIIKRAYELVSKEEMTYKVKSLDWIVNTFLYNFYKDIFLY